MLSANAEWLTAKANILPPEKLPALLRDWLAAKQDWPSLSPSEQLALIDLCRRSMARHKLPEATRGLIRATLQPHFPNRSSEINRALAPLLIELDPARAVPLTIQLLDASTDQNERIYYLFHLRHAKRGWTLKIRRTFFRVLNDYETFLGGRGLPQSLKNIRREAMATLTDTEKMALAKILDQKPALPPLPDLTGRKMVKQWQPADFDDALNFNSAQRDLANGRKMFHLAMCSRCHRHGREGYPIGPDLTHVASRFGRGDLLGEILDPSKSIAENYQTTILDLKDGRKLAGQIIPNLDYRVPNLQLAENPLHPDKITKIPKVQIIKQYRSDVSLMPPGLLNLLTKDEVLDLLAWLQTGAQ
jgi:putative heme-binding domain-containing protein